jgi:large subunit ribosomal protein L3
MNTQPGIFGRKVGSTQLFEQDGTVTRVTVIEAGPVVVVGKRAVEKDGYSALVLGLGAQSQAHLRAASRLLQESGRDPEAVGQRASV